MLENTQTTKGPPLDSVSFRGWIGRERGQSDVVTRRLLDSFLATLSPRVAPVQDGEAPLGIHWCLAPEIVGMEDIGSDGHAKKLGDFLPPIPLPRRMWAGGEVEFLRPLTLDAKVERRSRIVGVEHKQGRSGQLFFVAAEHNYLTGTGVCIRERQDLVYRDAQTTPSLERSAAPGPKSGDLAWLVPSSPALLFRYSALTFNGHRIHYDADYAVKSEGYSGLIVQAPLQATLLLNLAAVLLGRGPRHFSYRGVAPLVAGGVFQVTGDIGRDGSVSCKTTDANSIVTMTATAS